MIASETYVVPGTGAYDLTTRIRCATQLNLYLGGTELSEYVLMDGTAPSGTIITLTVSNPLQVFRLNRGDIQTAYSVYLDYYFSFPVVGGATLTLSIENNGWIYYKDAGGGTLVTGLPYFKGEYAQLNFVSTLDEDIYEEVGQGGKIARGWEWSGFDEFVEKTGAER